MTTSYTPTLVARPDGPVTHCVVRQRADWRSLPSETRTRLANSDSFQAKLSQALPPVAGVRGPTRLDVNPSTGFATASFTAANDCGTVSSGLRAWAGWYGIAAALIGTAVYLTLAIVIPAALNVVLPGSTANPWAIALFGCLGGGLATIAVDEFLGQTSVANRVNEVMQCFLGGLTASFFGPISKVLTRVMSSNEAAVLAVRSVLPRWLTSRFPYYFEDVEEIFYSALNEIEMQIIARESSLEGTGHHVCSLRDFGGRIICGYGARHHYFSEANVSQVFAIGTDYSVWTRWRSPSGMSAWTKLGGVIRHSHSRHDLQIIRQCDVIYITVIGTDNQKYQNARPPNGVWTGWTTPRVIGCGATANNA